MPSFSIFCATCFEQFQRARMRLAGLLVQEEGNRHAPVALARDAPVGAVGDHRMQPGLAPVGIEGRRLDGGQRLVAQAAAALDRDPVHADEPLRRRAVDDRRLVAPAVHVAVRDLAAREQRADLGQLLDDDRIGLPDEHAAEEWQARGKHAVALHRGQDFVVVHAVLLAGVVVLQAIGRRAMDDAGAGVERDVVAQIHGRGAIVEGMAEFHLRQRRALAGAQHLAVEAEALQRRAAQFGGEDDAAARRLLPVRR
jgi:hypothetical protein